MTDQGNPLTTGASRAPARAMLKAVGFSDADLKKPLIGVANPCSKSGRATTTCAIWRSM